MTKLLQRLIQHRQAQILHAVGIGTDIYVPTVRSTVSDPPMTRRGSSVASPQAENSKPLLVACLHRLMHPFRLMAAPDGLRCGPRQVSGPGARREGSGLAVKFTPTKQTGDERAFADRAGCGEGLTQLAVLRDEIYGIPAALPARGRPVEPARP